MIISKTPLRMSFVGGGSDLPSFYRKYGGAVVSTAIDKYIYITVNKKFDNSLRLSYSKTENVTSSQQLEHKLVKAVLSELNISGGLEITTIADVPSSGTGLGSSSSFTVGLLNALNAYNGSYTSAEALGHNSCKIEIDICNEPIGKQDQYAAAYGGFNFIAFNQDDSVDVQPIIFPKTLQEQLQNNILMFYTGITRSASHILKSQSELLTSTTKTQEITKTMTSLAYQLRDSLHNQSIDTFGEVLHENWLLKKSLINEISSSHIDAWYNKAMKAGAIGGKLLGAGAGGFLIFYAHKDAHAAIIASLKDLKLIKFRFENTGSRIIYYNN